MGNEVLKVICGKCKSEYQIDDDPTAVALFWECPCGDINLIDRLDDFPQPDLGGEA